MIPTQRIDTLRGREFPHRFRIVAAARHLLRMSRYVSLHRVLCDFDGKVLTLRGRVHSYYEKQIAQCLLLQRLQGFVVLHNQLEVGPASAPADSTFSSTVITHDVRQRLPCFVEA